MSRTLLLLSITLITGACTVGPDYVKPDVASPENWRVDLASAQDMANVHWWTGFNDPALNALIDEGLKHNRDILIATERVNEFAARLMTTRSAALPQAGYGAEGGRRQAPGAAAPGLPREGSDYEATLNVGWELDLWGRIRRATEASRAELIATEEGRRAIVLTLVSAIAISHIELLGLDKQLEIARNTLTSRGQALELFQIKFDGGVISDLELAQQRSEYEQAAVLIPQIEREIALRENAISILIGRHPGTIARDKPFDRLDLPPVPSGVPSDILERRPDIREAEQNLIAANARIGVAKAAFFPRISLTGAVGAASDDLTTMGAGSIWRLAGAAAGPIFTGGALKGELKATEAQQRQVLVKYTDTIQTAFREVEDALVSHQTLQTEVEARQRQVDALTHNAELARLRYDNGFVSYIEVLDAERRLFEAELSEVRTRNGVFTSLVSIYKAMGGGWIDKAGAIADQTAKPLPADEDLGIDAFTAIEEAREQNAAPASSTPESADKP